MKGDKQVIWQLLQHVHHLVDMLCILKGGSILLLHIFCSSYQTLVLLHRVKAGFSLYPGQTMKDFPNKVSVNIDVHCAAASFPLQSSGT